MNRLLKPRLTQLPGRRGFRRRSTWGKPCQLEPGCAAAFSDVSRPIGSHAGFASSSQSGGEGMIWIVGSAVFTALILGTLSIIFVLPYIRSVGKTAGPSAEPVEFARDGSPRQSLPDTPKRPERSPNSAEMLPAQPSSSSLPLPESAAKKEAGRNNDQTGSSEPEGSESATGETSHAPVSGEH